MTKQELDYVDKFTFTRELKQIAFYVLLVQECETLLAQENVSKEDKRLLDIELDYYFQTLHDMTENMENRVQPSFKGYSLYIECLEKLHASIIKAEYLPPEHITRQLDKK